jgi:hypothetical protein
MGKISKSIKVVFVGLSMYGVFVFVIVVRNFGGLVKYVKRGITDIWCPPV